MTPYFFDDFLNDLIELENSREPENVERTQRVVIFIAKLFRCSMEDSWVYLGDLMQHREYLPELFSGNLTLKLTMGEGEGTLVETPKTLVQGWDVTDSYALIQHLTSSNKLKSSDSIDLSKYTMSFGKLFMRKIIIDEDKIELPGTLRSHTAKSIKDIPFNDDNFKYYYNVEFSRDGVKFYYCSKPAKKPTLEWANAIENVRVLNTAVNNLVVTMNRIGSISDLMFIDLDTPIDPPTF